MSPLLAMMLIAAALIAPCRYMLPAALVMLTVPFWLSMTVPEFCTMSGGTKAVLIAGSGLVVL
jgi:hypothetical protein